MRSLVPFFRSRYAQLRSWIEREYSSAEIRSFLIVLGIGIAILFYRGYGLLADTYVPRVTSGTTIAQAKTDSLFAALSAQAAREDSMIFSLPPDSVAPRSMQSHLPKGSMLAPESIPLNDASKSELMELPGVGAATADRIIAFRELHSFRSIDEIKKVKTIGDARFNRMKSYLRLKR